MNNNFQKELMSLLKKDLYISDYFGKKFSGIYIRSYENRIIPILLIKDKNKPNILINFVGFEMTIKAALFSSNWFFGKIDYQWS